MKRVILFALMILMSACATSKNNFMTKQGFYFEAGRNKVEKLDAEMAIDLLTIAISEKGLGLTIKQIRYIFAMSNYVVKVKKKPIDCPTTEDSKRTCQGVHYRRGVIEYVHHENMSDTALVHELIHLLRYRSVGSGDPDHIDKSLWEYACEHGVSEDFDVTRCKINSLEGFVNSLMRGAGF